MQVKQAASDAASLAAKAPDDPELARVKAFALRVAQRLSRRVPLTARPALTRTVLNTFYKVSSISYSRTDCLFTHSSSPSSGTAA